MSSGRRSPAPQPPPPEVQLQPLLKALLESNQDKEMWTYAIFWEPTSSSAVLGWRDGYYNTVGVDKRKAETRTTCSAGEQERRKKVLRGMHALISDIDDSVSAYTGDEDVTDTEWFFLMSMAASFKFNNGGDLPVQAFLSRKPAWLSGLDQIEGPDSPRVRQGRVYGLRTMAFIPTANGVVELGSTEVLRQDGDLISKVLSSFDFTKDNRPI